MTLDYTIPDISNILLSLMWAFYLLMTLEPKRSRKRSALWLFLPCLTEVFYRIVLTHETIAPSLLSFFTMVLICAIVCSKDKWPRVILAVALMLFDMILCELLFSSLFPQVKTSQTWIFTQPRLKQASMYFLYLGMNAMLLWFSHIILRYRANHVPVKDMLLLALFPLSQFLLVILICHIQSGTNPAFIAWFQPFTTLVCILVDIPLFITISNMEQRMVLRLENERLDQQIEAQKKYYTALSAQYENIRFLQHDIANHVHTIQILLENSQTAEASAYAAELLPQHKYKSSLGACQNPVIDAFLFNAFEEATAKNIDMTWDIQLPAYIGIANAELISAFGNLMDNAVEACSQVGEAKPFINITAFMRPPYLCIETKNTLPQEETHKRKDPRVARGVGASILSEMAKQHDGEYRGFAEEGSYHAMLVLKTDAGKSA